MSAKLLRRDDPLEIEPFAAFALPEDEANFVTGQVLFGIANSDPESQAAQIIEDAQAKAAIIETVTRERMEATVRSAIQEEIISVINPWREKLISSLDELTTVRAMLAQQTENDLVRLALEIAQKVIQLEVQSNAQVAVELARAALARVPSRMPATIHLNPEDLAYVKANQQQLPRGHSLTFFEDPAIERGGCVVQTEMGEVDASIEQQFAQIEAALLEN
jgi:flagellar assembly protein FliH